MPRLSEVTVTYLQKHAADFFRQPDGIVTVTARRGGRMEKVAVIVPIREYEALQYALSRSQARFGDDTI